MDSELEIWKDIPSYEGLYQISNIGNVKNLERKVKSKNGKFRFIKEKILKPRLRGKYLRVSLSKEGKVKCFDIHQLLAITFLNHKSDGHKLVVDHIDNNQLNNNLSNIQVITHRNNCIKEHKGKSKFTGAIWNKNSGNWISRICIKNKRYNLGYYKCELSAHLRYIEELNKLNNG